MTRVNRFQRKYLSFEKSKAGQRCLRYIENRATEEGFHYCLGVTKQNENALLDLYQACTEFDAGNGMYTPEILQAKCDIVIERCRAGVLMGVVHPEPYDLSEYEKLFNVTLVRLTVADVPYSYPDPLELEVVWELQSDDPEVLKNKPGEQFKLPGFGSDEALGSN